MAASRRRQPSARRRRSTADGPADLALHVHLFHLRRAVHDELEARRDLAAHEGLDRLLGPGGVADRDLEERAARGVERRLLERRGVHLAEALEALHLERAAAAVPRGEEPLLLGVVARPEDLLAGVDAVERRLRDVDVALADQF